MAGGSGTRRQGEVGVKQEGQDAQPVGRAGRRRSKPGAAVTISEVARAAGVSTATVSNALNGRPGMAEETRARILAFVDELGYQINPTARNLRAGRTGAIGLLVPELDRPYFGQLATTLADGVEARGRHLVLQRSGGSREGELAAASYANLRMYDGVIVTVIGLGQADLERLNFTTPVVLVGERPVPSSFDHVTIDNVGGARRATEHLLERGARRIAVLGGTLDDTSAHMTSLRTRGWREAYRARGLEAPEELVRQLPEIDPATGCSAVKELAAEHEFDAVIAVTDFLAMGVLRGLADLGLLVPEQVQVVGFDDNDEAPYLVPSLTSVGPSKSDIASTILDLLEKRMREHEERVPASRRGRPVEATIGTHLSVRGSTRA
ncbi:LacI family DNA-binding transcriptional regulator [Kineosporia succinea]|uniref:DNA-binding LacI/PurR family transcriptional regulator n=1 Tax=Kineosporia succinea TaxID=84632 RepID=A0ABT9P8G0_9ACTN|nr:LacI family DNA-binding transcriptional regulator [Kineosporia succinea]MDP9828986.1 DNA-binding LacI/PurR family transcriptional regulator [Kineosporia succinea]